MNLFKTKYAALNVFTLMAVFFIGLGVYEQQYPWWYLLLIIIFYIVIAALGSVKIGWNFYNHNMNQLQALYMKFENGKFQLKQRNKEVVLTFDDGPHELTGEILEILKREKVPAVFFLIGKNISGKELIVERMHNDGHQVGNHSFHHGINFDWQSAAGMLKEIERTNEIIESVTQQNVTYFRPPYGVTNPMLAKAISLSKMTSVGWNIRSLDTTATDEQALIRKILKQLKPGAIILLHDRCVITKAILPELIQQIRKNGYEFTLLP